MAQLDENVDKYLVEIIQNGALSKDQIVDELRNYFEGPINMDFMLAGIAKNLFQKSYSTGSMPSKTEMAKTGNTLLVSLVQSQ